jgi:hypothetical protein
MHRKIVVIKGCGSPNCVHSIVEKDGEDNRKTRKTSQVVNQTLAPRLKHDKIRTIWVSNILSKSMMEEVRWNKCFEMES